MREVQRTQSTQKTCPGQFRRRTAVLPYETGRRRINRLLRLRLIARRSGKGIVVTVAEEASPILAVGVEAFTSLSGAFLARLADAGLTYQSQAIVMHDGAPGPEAVNEPVEAEEDPKDHERSVDRRIGRFKLVA